MNQLSVSQIRRIDAIAIEEFGMLGLVLMENAGRGAADKILTHVPQGGSVVILCGPGNNGGDGLVIARHLHFAGCRVHVWMIGDAERMSPDAAANYAILKKTRVPCHVVAMSASAFPPAMIENLRDADAIVDAMLGTGAQGAPRGAMGQAIASANQGPGVRFAIDIPSGMDADTGVCHEPTFRAHHTLTFVASKIGFASANASMNAGIVTVLSIGVPPEVLERAEVLD